MLGALRRLRIPASCSLEVWQLVWTDDWGLSMQNQTNQPPTKVPSSCWRSAPHFPCSQTFLLQLPLTRWTVVFSSRDYGKARQFSRIWHLWVILSQGLFFKGPPERLAWGLMLTLTLTVWPILGLNCKHEWENPLEQANCPFLRSFSYWFTFLRWGPGCCLELDGNFRN